MSMNHWNNNGGKRAAGRKVYKTATFSIINRTPTGLESNPGLRGKRPAKNLQIRAVALDLSVL